MIGNDTGFATGTIKSQFIEWFNEVAPPSAQGEWRLILLDGASSNKGLDFIQVFFFNLFIFFFLLIFDFFFSSSPSLLCLIRRQIDTKYWCLCCLQT